MEDEEDIKKEAIKKDVKKDEEKDFISWYEKYDMYQLEPTQPYALPRQIPLHEKHKVYSYDFRFTRGQDRVIERENLLEWVGQNFRALIPQFRNEMDVVYYLAQNINPTRFSTRFQANLARIYKNPGTPYDDNLESSGLEVVTIPDLDFKTESVAALQYYPRTENHVYLEYNPDTYIEGLITYKISSFEAKDDHLLFLDMDDDPKWTNDSCRKLIEDQREQLRKNYKPIYPEIPKNILVLSHKTVLAIFEDVTYMAIDTPVEGIQLGIRQLYELAAQVGKGQSRVDRYVLDQVWLWYNRIHDYPIIKQAKSFQSSHILYKCKHSEFKKFPKVNGARVSNDNFEFVTCGDTWVYISPVAGGRPDHYGLDIYEHIKIKIQEQRSRYEQRGVKKSFDIRVNDSFMSLLKDSVSEVNERCFVEVGDLQDQFMISRYFLVLDEGVDGWINRRKILVVNRNTYSRETAYIPYIRYTALKDFLEGYEPWFRDSWNEIDSFQKNLGEEYFMDYMCHCPNPKCRKIFVRDDGCDHIKCPIEKPWEGCGWYFCKVCSVKFEGTQYFHDKSTCAKNIEEREKQRYNDQGKVDIIQGIFQEMTKNNLGGDRIKKEFAKDRFFLYMMLLFKKVQKYFIEPHPRFEHELSEDDYDIILELGSAMCLIVRHFEINRKQNLDLHSLYQYFNDIFQKHVDDIINFYIGTYWHEIRDVVYNIIRKFSTIMICDSDILMQLCREVYSEP